MREISEKRYALRGTPTDCVIMAVTHVMPEKPDLVLSGVNSGANLADDVTYSGTVAGAMEGTLLGVRSIALSQAYTFDGQRQRRSVGGGGDTCAGAVAETDLGGDGPRYCSSM